MFEEKDFDAIMDEALEMVDDKFDKREGSVIYDMLAPSAMMLANFYAFLDMVQEECFADTASYYYLIKRAAERNLYPYEETSAIGKMKVQPSEIELSEGERFSIDDLVFSVVEKIENEIGNYKIECETAGIEGNKLLGTMLPLEYVEGLESAELTEILIPGKDEEDVENFRERYFASFKDNIFSGNKNDYIQKVLAIEGVGACKVIRAWRNGYNPSDLSPNESVKKWISRQTEESVGADTYSWITKIYDAAEQKLLTTGGTVKIVLLDSSFNKPSDTMVKTVQEALDPTEKKGEGYGIAPIGHVVNVVGAQQVKINIMVKIVYMRGYNFEKIKNDVEDAINEYFAELRKEWSDSDSTIIRIGKIETLFLNLDGVADVTKIYINGITENYTIRGDEIPVLSEVSEYV